MLHLSNKRKEKKKKRNINNDLAILPSYDNGGWWRVGAGNGFPCCCCYWQDMVGDGAGAGDGDGERDDNLYSIDSSSFRATT